MSVVVSVVKDGEVFMGADSCVTVGTTRQNEHKTVKVFKKGSLLFGGVGYLRDIQILADEFEEPGHPSRMSDEKYLISTVIPTILDHLAGNIEATDDPDLKLTKRSKNQSSIGSSFLVGYNGKIYEVLSDLGCLTHKEYAAIGSGEAYALGYLAGNYKYEADPKYLIRKAVDVAALFNPFVKKPCTIVTL